MASNNTDRTEVLLETYREAKTEEAKQVILTQIFDSLSDSEKETYASTERMALMLAHIDNTKKALEERYDRAKALCEVFGFPVAERVEAGNNTVQLNTTITVLDTERLSEMVMEDTLVAERVGLAIENKRAKVTIDTLTLTDLRNVLNGAPVTTKRKLAVYIKPRKA